MKASKKEFFELLDFLSDFVGLNDLADEEYQDELWGYYNKERK